MPSIAESVIYAGDVVLVVGAGVVLWGLFYLVGSSVMAGLGMVAVGAVLALGWMDDRGLGLISGRPDGTGLAGWSVVAVFGLCFGGAAASTLLIRYGRSQA